ncbi:MAG: hypothetical protein VR72_17325 [Clostridiaceae bacterium BRH_c20a]|nr:MAG: hypothetical protein VR72_17325 [Clostridiaceae bacterium BRH_c20a]
MINNDFEGKIINIQRFSIHDGPGIRTVIFMKGCPLKCLWCSNPESQKFNAELTFSKNYCQNCGSCIPTCQLGALKIREGLLEIDRKRCNNCGECVVACSNNALKKIGKDYTVSEVIKEIKKDQAYYRRSGGGVTLSGGEVSAQPRFAVELLKESHLHGYNTCIETCGYQKWDILSRIIEETDLVFYDLKVLDPQKHKIFTGIDNSLIIHNLLKLSNLNKPFVLRMPIIPSLNTNKHDLKQFSDFVTTLKNIIRLELIPYHNYGVYKYESLDISYTLNEIGTPNQEDLNETKTFLEKQGLNVNIQLGG